MSTDDLRRVTGGGYAFGTLCFVGVAGFIVGSMWLAPPVGGRVETAGDPPDAPTVEFPPDPDARLTAEESAEMRGILADHASDRQAASPDPFMWASDPDKARRVQAQLDAEAQRDAVALKAIEALERGPRQSAGEAREGK